MLATRHACSLTDMLYRRRMARQLAAARGETMGEKPPGEDESTLPTAGKTGGGYVPPSVRCDDPPCSLCKDGRFGLIEQLNSVKVRVVLAKSLVIGLSGVDNLP